VPYGASHVAGTGRLAVNRRRGTFVAAALTVALSATCCVAAGLLVKGHVLHRLYNDLVLDNRDHYLPCEKLPTPAEVYRVVEEHQDTVEAIKEVHPGFVFVEMDDWSCSGRADIVISYASHQDRLAIQELIGDTFFGVPYRLRNI
jgi:hypothetical protein